MNIPIRLVFVVVALWLVCATGSAQAFNDHILYNFLGKTDGGNPIGGVVQDAAGNYYGETFQAGSYTCPNPPYSRQGCGTVYRLSPNGIFTVLLSFTGANGAHGNITPILIGNTLYGATSQGGTGGAGVIFSVRTDGTGFSIVHQFAGMDGGSPQALVVGPHSTIYGIAATGGAYGYGTLFSISASGSYTDLHDFNQPAGAEPVSLLIGSATLVGSTGYGGGDSSTGCQYGCGTIFTYTTTTRTFSTVFSFPSSISLGAFPYVGSIGPGPTIYGANGSEVFSLSAATGYTNLLTLDFYATGLGVTSGPVYTPSGTLFGTLLSSAAASNGLVYSLAGGAFAYQAVFDGSAAYKDGASPQAKPILNHDGNLVGTTALNGKCSACGAIWLSVPGS